MSLPREIWVVIVEFAIFSSFETLRSLLLVDKYFYGIIKELIQTKNIFYNYSFIERNKNHKNEKSNEKNSVILYLDLGHLYNLYQTIESKKMTIPGFSEVAPAQIPTSNNFWILKYETRVEEGKNIPINYFLYKKNKEENELHLSKISYFGDILIIQYIGTETKIISDLYYVFNDKKYITKNLEYNVVINHELSILFDLREYLRKN